MKRKRSKGGGLLTGIDNHDPTVPYEKRFDGHLVNSETDVNEMR